MKNQRNHTKGQAAIEFTVALVAIVILFAGIVKVWAWMVNGLVLRQQAYEQTRTVAGTRQITGPIDPATSNPTYGTIDPATGKLTYGPIDPAIGKLTYYQPACLSVFGEDTSKDCR